MLEFSPTDTCVYLHFDTGFAFGRIDITPDYKLFDTAGRMVMSVHPADLFADCDDQQCFSAGEWASNVIDEIEFLLECHDWMDGQEGRLCLIAFLEDYFLTDFPNGEFCFED